MHWEDNGEKWEKDSEEGHKSDLLPIKLSETLKELYLLMLFKGSEGLESDVQEPV